MAIAEIRSRGIFSATHTTGSTIIPSSSWSPTADRPRENPVSLSLSLSRRSVAARCKTRNPICPTSAEIESLAASSAAALLTVPSSLSLSRSPRDETDRLGDELLIKSSRIRGRNVAACRDGEKLASLVSRIDRSCIPRRLFAEMSLPSSGKRVDVTVEGKSAGIV